MQRIAGPGAIDGLFVEEDVGTGQPPTQITAAWMNAVQEEIANVIEADSTSLDSGSNFQLLAKIGDLILSIGDAHYSSVALEYILRDMLVGQLAYFFCSTPPTGFAHANGAAVSRTAYANLFARIGVLYGVGDGTTTFNLPDARGIYPRGLDLGRGLYSDAGISFGDLNYQEFVGSTSGTEPKIYNMALLPCIKY